MKTAVLKTFSFWFQPEYLKNIPPVRIRVFPGRINRQGKEMDFQNGCKELCLHR